MSTIDINCPHCGKKVDQINVKYSKRIACPIKLCPFCSKEHLDQSMYEWSILSLFHKFEYCFLANGRWIFLLGISIFLPCQQLIAAVATFALWIIASLFRLKFSDSDKIKDSYNRTKNNPEYIQKLSDMGYIKMAIHIDPYYK